MPLHCLIVYELRAKEGSLRLLDSIRELSTFLQSALVRNKKTNIFQDSAFYNLATIFALKVLHWRRWWWWWCGSGGIGENFQNLENVKAVLYTTPTSCRFGFQFCVSFAMPFHHSEEFTNCLQLFYKTHFTISNENKRFCCWHHSHY